MSYLAGPAVLHNDGRPEVSRTGVDRVLPSRPVQGSWQSPRRALRGPRTVENTACVAYFYFFSMILSERATYLNFGEKRPKIINCSGEKKTKVIREEKKEQKICKLGL